MKMKMERERETETVLKAVKKIKELQCFRYTSKAKDRGVIPLLELSQYEYEYLQNILDMDAISKAVNFSGYFIDDELIDKEFDDPEEFWNHRINGNAFNLNPTGFMLRVEEKGKKVFTEEFCKNLLIQISKLEYLVKTDILAESLNISIEEAMEIFNNDIKVQEGWELV